MSKSLRTVAQLQDALDAERVWRLRELSTLRKRLLQPISPGVSSEEDLALLRPCVTMIYAHWEGFVKASCSAYLQFVSLQRLPQRSMSTPFLALAARRQAAERGLTGAAADRFMLQLAREAEDERFLIPYKGGVDTKSNLWFEVFEEVMTSLGLSAANYSLRQKMIDTQLVAKRNAIAHGRYIDVGVDEVNGLFESVIELMSEIKDQLLDAADQKTYSLVA